MKIREGILPDGHDQPPRPAVQPPWPGGPGSWQVEAGIQARTPFKLPPDEVAKRTIGWRSQTAGMARRAREYLPYVRRDNHDLDADRLAEIASRLSPGGSDNGADLYRALTQCGMPIDKHLRAALIYRNWHGGRAGFQFMPDPMATPLAVYLRQAEALVSTLIAGHGGNLRRLLINDDLKFYERLPDTFAVYRGVDGVSVRKAAAGPCWTLSRDLAEWFAHRTLQPFGPVDFLLKLRHIYQMLKPDNRRLCRAQHHHRIDRRDVYALVEHVDREDHVDFAVSELFERSGPWGTLRACVHRNGPQAFADEKGCHEIRVSLGTAEANAPPSATGPELLQRIAGARLGDHCHLERFGVEAGAPPGDVRVVHFIGHAEVVKGTKLPALDALVDTGIEHQVLLA